MFLTPFSWWPHRQHAPQLQDDGDVAGKNDKDSEDAVMQQFTDTASDGSDGHLEIDKCKSEMTTNAIDDAVIQPETDNQTGPKSVNQTNQCTAMTVWKKTARKGLQMSLTKLILLSLQLLIIVTSITMACAQDSRHIESHDHLLQSQTLKESHDSQDIQSDLSIRSCSLISQSEWTVAKKDLDKLGVGRVMMELTRKICLLHFYEFSKQVLIT